MSAEALVGVDADLDALLEGRLNDFRREAADNVGATELWVAGRMVQAARRVEQDVASTLRRNGATLRQLADDARLPSRQAARSKFSGTGREALPGRTAVDVARQLGISDQTVASSYAKYGVELRAYPAEPRALRRYFLPGDPGHSATE
ncbi:hypothetical protein [Arthrobacter sp. 2MCAF14]|uniref:hypothetical protein n=1 Tax=Arthrobacter sp. 2MCAF14 TaxID=3232982 RepID=UPI003F913754